MKYFEEKDFAGMKFNPYSVKGDMLKKHRILSKYDTFVMYSGDNKDKLIRYIMYMYDHKSPLVKWYTDIFERKNQSATLAGFDLEKDKEFLVGVFDLTGDTILDMVFEFIRDMHSYLWSMIVTSEQTFYEYQKSLLDKVTISNSDKQKIDAIVAKSKLMEDSDAIVKRLENYKREMFGEGEDGAVLVRKATTPEAQVDV